MRILILTTIRFYQAFVSPLLHVLSSHFFLYGGCRFYPSCSKYIEKAIDIHGFWRGALKGLIRLGRCNPFAKGGYDPIIDKNLKI